MVVEEGECNLDRDVRYIAPGSAGGVGAAAAAVVGVKAWMVPKFRLSPFLLPARMQAVRCSQRHRQ